VLLLYRPKAALQRLLGWSVLWLIIGLALDLTETIRLSKAMWSVSFVFFMSAVATLLLAALYYLIDGGGDGGLQPHVNAALETAALTEGAQLLGTWSAVKRRSESRQARAQNCGLRGRWRWGGGFLRTTGQNP